MNIIGQFFAGVISALKEIDTETMINAIGAAGLLTALVVAIGLVTPLIPAAMAGVLGLGAVAAELAIVLAAIGALASIPGFTWLIDKGGDLMQKLGNAIGKFIGGIIGGIAEGVTSSLPKIAKDLSKFMTNMEPFVNGITSVDDSVLTGAKTLMSAMLAIAGSSIVSKLTGTSSLTKVSKAVTEASKALKNLANLPKDCAKNFTSALKELSKTSADSLLKEFKDIKSDMKKAGQNAVEEFVKGVKDKSGKAKDAFKTLASDCAKAILNKKGDFKDAGKDVVIGFAEGISANTFQAEAKAKAMAEKALEAAKKKLKINSPSKEFMKVGMGVPEGFAKGIDKFSSLVTKSSVGMADSAISNVSRSISRMADIVNSDIDTEPTIRPVLDLSDVRSGVGTIGNLLAMDSSVGVLANVGAINTMMNRRIQNGTNNDVVSAINKLRKDIGNIGGDQYNINGVSYDAESDVASAVKTIARAIKVGGRV